MKTLKTIIFVILFSGLNSAYATDYQVGSISELQSISGSLQKGDTVILADGYYSNFGSIIIENLKGSPLNPITIKAQTLFGVKISGNSTLTFKNCDYLNISGFQFEGMTRFRALNLQECNYSKVSQCNFINSGDVNTKLTMLRFDVDNTDDPLRNAYNVVENCLFSRIQGSIGLIIAGAASKQNIGQNIIRNNIFRNTDYIIENGAEAIVLWTNGLQNDNPLHSIVEGNVFDSWNGDGEIISVKSGRNIFKHNVFTNYSQGSLSLRREKGNVVESNYFLNGNIGVWAYGEDHKILNNIFVNMEFEAIRLTGGGNLVMGSPVFETAKNNLIANNTVLGTEAFFVKFLTLDPFEEERPIGNTIVNNVFSSATGIDFYRFYEDANGNISEIDTNTFENNLYWNQNNADLAIPNFGTNNIVADPGVTNSFFKVFGENSPVIDNGQVINDITLDFFRNPRGDVYDIGHVELPYDASNYDSPFMFFPPDVEGFELMPISAEFEYYPKNIQTGDIVMIDARSSKGNFSSLKWILNGQSSEATTADVYSFEFDAAKAYTVELQLLDSSGNILSSKTLNLGFNIQPDTHAPTAPENLEASNLLFNDFDISWDYSTDNVAVVGYNIYLDSEFISTTTDTNTERLSYSFSGLTQDTEYIVLIEAFDAAGNKSSNSLIVKTPAPDITAPSIPSGLSVLDLYSTSVNISWNDSVDPEDYQSGVEGYEIYVDGSYISTSETSSFLIENLSTNTAYNVKVLAFDASGNKSDFSETLTFTTKTTDTEAPSLPSNLTPTNVGYLSLDVSWEVSTDNEYVVGYNVYLDGIFKGYVENANYSFSGLLPSTEYLIEVEAIDVTGNKSIKASLNTSTITRSNIINATTAEEFLYFLPILEGGDTLILATGVYADLGEIQISNLPGSLSAPITIKSEKPYGAVFTGNTEFRFIYCDYLNIEGFSFNGITLSSNFRHILRLTGSDYSSVSQCSFVNSGTADLRLTSIRFDGAGNTFNTVQNCLFENLVGGGMRFDIATNSVGGNKIVNNVFRNSLPRALASILLIGGGDVSNTLVSGNVFDRWDDTFTMNIVNGGNIIKNNNFSYSNAIQQNGGNKNVFDSNFFMDSSNNVLRLFGEDNQIKNNIFLRTFFEGINLSASANNNLIANNTFLDGPRSLIVFGGAASGNKIYNNIFSTYQRDMILNLPAGNLNTLDYNIYHNSGSAIIPPLSSNDITSDPQLNDDLFLTVNESSPAINSGLFLNEVPFDIYGNARINSDRGHITYPSDLSDFQTPFMFFPPKTDGFDSQPLEAVFDKFSDTGSSGDIIMLDAVKSKGEFDKYRWTISAYPSSEVIVSEPIDESVYSFIFDDTQLYTIKLELLDDEGNVLAESSSELKGDTVPVLPLSVTAECSSNPYTERIWTIINENPFAVDYTWALAGSPFSGDGVLESNQILELSTEAIEGENKLIVSWEDENDVLQNVEVISEINPCDSNFQVERLVLSYVCTENYGIEKLWMIHNPQSFNVFYTWTLKNSDQQGSYIASPGDNYMTTSAIDKLNMLTIEWKDETGKWKQSTKSTEGASCEAQTKSKSPSKSGTEEIDNNLDFQIYPNPVNETLYVKSSYLGEIKLFDVTGKNILSQEIGEGINSIDLRSFQNGLYIYKLIPNNDNQTVFNGKFLIK